MAELRRKLKQFAGLSVGQKDGKVMATSTAESITASIEDPNPTGVTFESSLKILVEVLDEGPEPVVLKFAESVEFVHSLTKCIESRKETINDNPDAPFMSHEVYHQTLLCILSLVDSTKVLRQFIKCATDAKLLQPLAINLCAIIQSDIAFYTQEMALDIVCRVCILSMKAKDTELPAAVRRALPVCVQSYFASVDSCIEILRDTRVPLMAINNSVDNPHVASVYVTSISVDATAADVPVRGGVGVERKIQAGCYVDLNGRSLTFIQDGEDAGFVKIPFDEMRRVNYVNSGGSACAMQLAVQHPCDHLKALMNINFKTLANPSALLTYPTIKFEFQNKTMLDRVRAIMASRLEREQKVQDLYADSQEGRDSQQGLLDKENIGHQVPSKSSFVTTRNKGLAEHLLSIREHNLRVQLTASQEEKLRFLGANAARQEEEDANVTRTTEEEVSEAITDYAPSPSPRFSPPPPPIEKVPVSRAKKPRRSSVRGPSQLPPGGDSLVTALEPPSSEPHSVGSAHSNTPLKGKRRLSPATTLFEKLPEPEPTVLGSRAKRAVAEPAAGRGSAKKPKLPVNRGKAVSTSRPAVKRRLNAAPSKPRAVAGGVGSQQSVFEFGEEEEVEEPPQGAESTHGREPDAVSEPDWDVPEPQYDSPMEEEAPPTPRAMTPPGGKGAAPPTKLVAPSPGTPRMRLGSAMKFSAHKAPSASQQEAVGPLLGLKTYSASKPVSNAKTAPAASTARTRRPGSTSAATTKAPTNIFDKIVADAVNAGKKTSVTINTNRKAVTTGGKAWSGSKPTKVASGKKAPPPPHRAAALANKPIPSVSAAPPPTLSDHDGNANDCMEDYADEPQDNLDFGPDEPAPAPKVEAYTSPSDESSADEAPVSVQVNSLRERPRSGAGRHDRQFTSSKLPDKPVPPPKVTKAPRPASPPAATAKRARKGDGGPAAGQSPIQGLGEAALSPIYPDPDAYSPRSPMQLPAFISSHSVGTSASAPGSVGRQLLSQPSPRDASYSAIDLHLHGALIDGDLNTPVSSADTPGSPNGEDDAIGMLVNELLAMQKGRLQKKRSHQIASAAKSTTDQIGQYLDSWSAHELHNHGEDVVPVATQKVATYGAMVDKFVGEVQADAEAFLAEEARLQGKVAGLVQSVNKLKAEVEVDTRHWSKEEDRVIQLISTHRANVIKTSRKLLQEQEKEASKQHKHQSLDMLSALRGLR